MKYLMYEVKNITQDSKDYKRRHFTNDFFDLYTWQDDKQNIISFQLCYDIYYNEHALTWKNGSFNHKKIDYKYRKTPILLPDGPFNKNKISEEFKKASLEIDKKVANFIYTKLLEYDEKNQDILNIL